LRALLPAADLYLQDERQITLPPTRTRVWCRKGRRGQRLVEAPGENAKAYGFGLVDWRAGWRAGRSAAGRSAAVFGAQGRAALARARQRGRGAIVLTDNLKTPTPRGARLVRALRAEAQGPLLLVYSPSYDPDANRIAWLWRPVRPALTHKHHRQEVALLLAALQTEFEALSGTPSIVLAHSGSPFALEDEPTQPLTRAA
jgi:transposase